MAVLVPYLDASWRASTWQGQGARTLQSIVPAPVSAPTYCGCGPRSGSSSAWYTPTALSLLKPFIDYGVRVRSMAVRVGFLVERFVLRQKSLWVVRFCRVTYHSTDAPYSYVRFVVYILTADVKQTARKAAKPQDLKWHDISSVSFFLHVRNAPNGKYKFTS